MKELFSTGIHIGQLKLSSKVKNEIKTTSIKIPKVDVAGVAWSKKNYTRGYTSYGSLERLHEQFSVFELLKNSLDREVAKFSKGLGLKFPRGELCLSSMWVNVMPAHCYHAFHIHPNSVISGTYYVSLPKGASPLRIEDPRAGLFMASPPRPIRMDLIPKEGDVILFESWLKHEVPPHTSKQNRISVSFNYDWIQN